MNGQNNEARVRKAAMKNNTVMANGMPSQDPQRPKYGARMSISWDVRRPLLK